MDPQSPPQDQGPRRRPARVPAPAAPQYQEPDPGLPDLTDDEIAMINEVRERRAQEQQRRVPSARMVPQSQPRPAPAPVQVQREPVRVPRRIEEEQFREPIRPESLKDKLFHRPAREVSGPRRMPVVLRIVLLFTGSVLAAIGAMLNGSWYTPATAFHGGLAEVMYGWSVGAIFLVVGCIVVYHAVRGVLIG